MSKKRDTILWINHAISYFKSQGKTQKDTAFFKVVVIIRLVIKRLFFLDLDEPHQRVHSS